MDNTSGKKAKRIFVISILNKNFSVMYDGEKIRLISKVSIGNLEHSVSTYIESKLSNHNYSIEELRTILSKIQVKINLSNEQNMLNSIENFFNEEVNIFYNQENQIQDINSKIDELKKQRDQIMYASGVIPEEIEGTLNDEIGEGQERGRQRVYSNGHSTLAPDNEKKNAFTSALVLALLVEIFGLVIFTLLLIKII